MFADLIDRQVEVPISETFLLLRIIGGGGEGTREDPHEIPFIFYYQRYFCCFMTCRFRKYL